MAMTPAMRGWRIEKWTASKYSHPGARRRIGLGEAAPALWLADRSTRTLALLLFLPGPWFQLWPLTLQTLHSPANRYLMTLVQTLSMSLSHDLWIFKNNNNIYMWYYVQFICFFYFCLLIIIYKTRLRFKTVSPVSCCVIGAVATRLRKALLFEENLITCVDQEGPATNQRWVNLSLLKLSGLPSAWASASSPLWSGLVMKPFLAARFGSGFKAWAVLLNPPSLSSQQLTN